jgi:peptidyl-tRNA hydrolase, PTH1 family
VGDLKVIACLGNPGPEYSRTRHNVGWWLADRLAESWALSRFEREGTAVVATGHRGGLEVDVVKPLTFMNRSGKVLTPLASLEGFEVTRDLLIVVDDVALDPGRARLRGGGSAGGHNGLKSIEAVLGTQDYARLRIGVGEKPPGRDLADWVLSAPPPEDRAAIMAIFPELIDCIGMWMTDGVEAAQGICNR